MLRTHDFSTYDGWRTPGYPWFLNLFHAVPENVVRAQNVLGMLAAFLLAFVYWRLSRKTRPSFLLGVFLALSFNLLFVDEYLLTESLSIVLFSCFSALTVLSFSRTTASLWSWALCGSSVAALVLTRPQYVALLPAMVLALLLRRMVARPSPPLALSLFLFLGLSLPPVLSLMAFNKAHLGTPTLSTTLSFNLSQHTLPFIEAAETVDETGLVPKIVRLRDAHWAQAQALDDNRAFIPRPDPYPLPDIYLRLSLEAIRRCPGKYLRSVWMAWLRFWRVSLLYDPAFQRSAVLDRIVSWLWIPQKCLWGVANVLFVLNLPLVALNVLKRRCVGWMEILSLAILSVSVLQALVEYGDNARYAIPMQPAIALVALYSATSAGTCRFTFASLCQTTRKLFRGSNP